MKLVLKSKPRFAASVAVTVLAAALIAVVNIMPTKAEPKKEVAHIEQHVTVSAPVVIHTTPAAIHTTPAAIKAHPVTKPQVFKKKIDRGNVHRPEDIQLLAKVIHGEAGNQTYSGKLAVGTVIMNRMIHPNKKSFGGPTMKGVIFKHGQFDCVQSNWEDPDEDSIKAAKQVLNGYRSFRSSIVYYFNPDIATDHAFMRTVSVVMTIDNHSFGEER
jgi:spore germination cell wall hydrolase CwlJ-like protein